MNDFGAAFVSEYLNRKLQTMTDEQVLEFIGKQILPRLTPAQSVKLRAFINQRIPDVRETRWPG